MPQVEPVHLATSGSSRTVVWDHEDIQARVLASVVEQLGDVARHARQIMEDIGGRRRRTR